MGAGISLIVGGMSDKGLVALLTQPILMVGPSMLLTMEYHDRFKSNPKYLEYQETIRKRKQSPLTITNSEPIAFDT